MANETNKVHVKTGDTVVVISGKDAGKKGKVIAVEPKKGRVYVDKTNVVKRHTKPTQAAPQGGILEKEAPIDSSNVMIYCASCDRPVRIKKVQQGDGSYVRACAKCGAIFDK